MTTQPVESSEIEKELSRIWEGLEAKSKMRASLFNLIFYTKKDERVDYLKEVARTVVERFPSRVIFITAGDGESYLQTRVSVLSMGEGDLDIVCDSIEIDVGGADKERVPFLILPHILPDLPVYTLWAEDPKVDAKLLVQLQKLSTRLIFDSEAAQDLYTFAQDLLNIEETLHCDIADLNWGRMESWRDLLTSTFYTQERLEALQRSKALTILYNSKETSACKKTALEALYLQGWIAAQMGWELQSIEKGYTLRYMRDGGSVEVRLVPESQPNVKAGSIISVDIETDDQLHFSFGRHLDTPHHVSMRISTLEKCDIPLNYIFAKDESGQSLVKEICHKGTSSHYLNLLHQIQANKEYANCGS